MQSDISIFGIKSQLKPSLLPIHVEVLETTESTNDYLKGKECLNKSLIVAKAQTKGKGRLGKTFLCYDGGIYMSLKLEIDSTNNLNYITPCAAVAVSKVVDKYYNVNTKIKWVNDIYLQNKKISGILTEVEFSGQDSANVIIGVGINIEKYAFPTELENIATSVGNVTDIVCDKSKIIAEITNSILEEIENINKKEFIKYYKEKSNLIGKTITVTEGDNMYTAKAISIDNECKLIIEKDGEVKALYYGEVSTKI